MINLKQLEQLNKLVLLTHEKYENSLGYKATIEYIASNIDILSDVGVTIEDISKAIFTQDDIYYLELNELEFFNTHCILYDNGKFLISNDLLETRDIPLSIDDLQESEELCKYCVCTDYGLEKVGTNEFNMCEGICCDEAYDYYLELFEEGEV